MVFLDTPGLLEPAVRAAARHARHRPRARSRTPTSSSTSSTPTERPPPPLVEAARARRAAHARRSSLVAQQGRRARRGAARGARATRIPDARFISALTGDGVDELLARARRAAPREPVPLSRRTRSAPSTVRFFVAELVRETALEQLDDEVPVQRRVRDRGVPRGRSRRCTFGRSSTSSARARSASSSAPAGSASATSARRRA